MDSISDFVWGSRTTACTKKSSSFNSDNLNKAYVSGHECDIKNQKNANFANE